MKAPALGGEEVAAEEFPIDEIRCVAETMQVAEHAHCALVGALGVMQGDVDAEAVIAPMDIRALLVAIGNGVGDPT